MRTARTSRSPVRWFAAATAVVALLAPTAAAHAQTAETPSSVLTDHAKTIRLPGPAGSDAGGPWDIAVTGNAVWALAPRAGTVFRIDPKTNRVAARVKLPALGCIPAACNGSDHVVATTRDVWVQNNDAGSLVHINARRNKVTGSVAFTPGLYQPPLPDATGVWLSPDASVGDVVHVAAKTNEVDKTVHVGVAPVWPAGIVDGMLWVGGAVFHQGSPPDETLYQVDPETATVVGTVPGASGGGAVLGDDLWLNRICCPLVSRVDGATGAPEQDLRVDGFSNFLTAGGGFVWVRMIDQNGAKEWINQVNPADGSITRYDLPVPNLDGGLGFGHGSLWVADWDANAVHRMAVPVR
jgi:hypothetical protein